MVHMLCNAREGHNREEQNRFCAIRGCIDQVFTLQQLLEPRYIFKWPTITVFLDIRAAYDFADTFALRHC